MTSIAGATKVAGDRLQQAKREYISSDLSSHTAVCRALAPHYGVTFATFSRMAKRYKWDEMRKEAIALRQEGKTYDVSVEVINEACAIAVDDDRLNVEELVRCMIQDLAEASKAVDARSKEGAANAAARLIDSYRLICPMTYDDLVDACLAIPGFSPREFALHLKRRIEGVNG